MTVMTVTLITSTSFIVVHSTVELSKCKLGKRENYTGLQK